jgi:RNA polymerase sigma-70 factor, ECF subfamily
LSVEELFCQAASDDLESREAAEAIATSLMRLSTEQREVVELKIYGRLTLREIAEVIRVPQGTAATRYRSAVEQLRKWFSESVS